MALIELYSDKILDIAGNASQPGRLAAPQASARKVSRVCGSLIEVDVVVTDGIISAYGHEVSACALGQTSAAIVAREIVGTPVETFLALSRQMRDMLKGEGEAPGGKWSDLGYLEAVRDFPARHASTLLVFEAVADALKKIDTDQRAAAEI
ncbi:iron-sulfur cluster assembly scaffold protein [Devosia sp. BK]|uniref:iron-sulfur cluster assembly scaffold protein n=1 Tax=Devosia sp. BK TaxID=2871706 RepID=UPI002939A248|nr:iron-sulfur cluster assembly scaffold protein [Devosia sp. BK]MDV3250579.1 iron-sulfur cluster assembly scaffold protein [Devosia sp. BK]